MIWLQPHKCEDLLLFSVIVTQIPLGTGLLVRQKKKKKIQNIILGSGRL